MQPMILINHGLLHAYRDGLADDKTLKKVIYLHTHIKSRCKNHPAYVRRGIKANITASEILTLWQRDNAQNLKNPSIDRINTYGDYSLENCRFIELTENLRRFKAKGLPGLCSQLSVYRSIRSSK